MAVQNFGPASATITLLAFHGSPGLGMDNKKNSQYLAHFNPVARPMTALLNNTQTGET
ncbi:hypothetical protein [Amphritea sp. HPY]|uniref:hypothetical protein n=1 Tax=Amphritea sp. HPY TaxID=3421652 RepID=UPI003D7C9838